MDHFSQPNKQLDFNWLFFNLKNGSLETELKKKSIEELGDINTQLDYNRQQMVKKFGDSPNLESRHKDMVQAMTEAAKIVLKVISEKGPKQTDGREVF